MSTEEPQVASIAAWKKARDHTVRLPSGVYVDIAIPDLAALIESGEIPQNLLDAALKAAGAGSQAEPEAPSREFIIKEKEFSDALVRATVSRPKLSEADVKEVPFEDKVMLVEVATRQRDLDAEGNHIGGLHKSDSFRKFRGLDGFDSTMEDV